MGENHHSVIQITYVNPNILKRANIIDYHTTTMKLFFDIVYTADIHTANINYILLTNLDFYLAGKILYFQIR